MKAERLTLSLIVALLLGLGVAPLLAMITASVTVDGGFSLAHYQTLFTAERTWRLLGRSLLLASLTALGAALLGVPLGVLFGKTDLACRRIFTFLFTVPLLLPPYVLAIAWSGLLGREGWLGRLLRSPIAELASAWLFSLPGCIWVLTTVFLPVVMLVTIAFLHTVDPRLEEAGRLAARWPRILRGITLPTVGRGIVASTLLTFLLALGEFTVPMYLRYDVFPVESLTQFSAFYDFSAATAAALPLALVILAVLTVERLGARAPTVPTAPAGGMVPIPLGGTRPWWLALTGLLCVTLVILPLGALILESSLSAFAEVSTRAMDALLRSLLYGAVGATALVVFGFFVGYLLHTRALPLAGTVDFFTLFLLVIPSPVIGIGLIGLWNRPATAWLYASPAIVLFGYVAQYVALTSRITAAALAQVPHSFEQAAALMGAGWFRRLAFIITPLMGRGLLLAWLVAYIFCLRDTGIAMLVYPPGHDTLPVRLFTLMANSPFERVAALCVLLIAATLLPLMVLGLLWMRWRPAT